MNDKDKRGKSQKKDQKEKQNRRKKKTVIFPIMITQLQYPPPLRV